MKDDSVWKKEISFRRKPKAEAPAAAAPAEAKQSIWKKEIHLGRKSQPEPLPPLPVAPPPELELPLLVEVEPVVTVVPIVELEPVVELAPDVELAPEPVTEPWLSSYEPEPEPVAEVEPEPVVELEPMHDEPLAELEPLEATAEVRWPQADDAPWLADSELREQPAPEAFPVEPEHVWPEPAAEPWQPAYELPPVEPVAETEQVDWLSSFEPEPVAEAEPEDELWLADYESPQLESEPVFEPEPVLESEPVVEPESVAESWPPAYEPPPLLPLLPEPEPEPVAAFAPEPAPEPLFAEPEVPWWKREVTLPQLRRHEAPPKLESAPEPSASRRRARVPFSLPRPAVPGARRATRVVGLKVGGSQVAAACVANNGGVRLEQLARMPLASGIVTGGELRDPEALATALKALFVENKLPRRGVRLGIASSRIGVRSFEISGIRDEHQFVNAVRFRAQETLPIPLDEAVLDYRVLDEREGADGELIRRVLLVVAHRDLVERYVQACRLAGLTLAGIDLEAFALLRALAPPADREGSALVAVSIGHERTTLAVSDGRICEFTRVLEWGGWVLNVALARALDSTPSEVELVKRNLSLADGAPPPGLSPEQAAAAVEAVEQGVESLARELVSSLQFYQAQPGSLDIGEVVVTGGTARLAGLAEELERLLGVPVRVGDPLRRLDVAQPVDESEVGSLAIAIGLGIDD